MRPLDDPHMLAQDLAFCSDNGPLRVNPQARRTVGERGRHAVSVALEVDQAGRRHTLGMLDEAIKRSSQRHQAGDLIGVNIGNGARQRAMLDLAPLLDTLRLKPRIQRILIGEAGYPCNISRAFAIDSLSDALIW